MSDQKIEEILALLKGEDKLTKSAKKRAKKAKKIAAKVIEIDLDTGLPCEENNSTMPENNAATTEDQLEDLDTTDDTIPNSWEELVTDEVDEEIEEVNYTDTADDDVDEQTEEVEHTHTSDEAINEEETSTIEPSVDDCDSTWHEIKSKKSKRCKKCKRQDAVVIVDMYGDRVDSVNNLSSGAESPTNEVSGNDADENHEDLLTLETEQILIETGVQTCTNDDETQEPSNNEESCFTSEDKNLYVQYPSKVEETKICKKAELQKVINEKKLEIEKCKLETKQVVDGVSKGVEAKETALIISKANLLTTNEEICQLQEKLNVFRLKQTSLVRHIECQNEVIALLHDDLLQVKSKAETKETCLKKELAHLEDELEELAEPAETLETDPLLAFLEDSILAKAVEVECPVCLEEACAGAALYMCEEQHLVCGACRPRLRECPTCRLAYPAWQAPRRHRYAERAAAELQALRLRREGLRGARTRQRGC